MTRKVDVPVTSRDIYFTPAGDDAWTGASPEVAVTSPDEAILRVNALSPAPSIFNPASINASQTGVSTNGIVMPDNTSANAELFAIVTSDAIAIEMGNNQSVSFGAVVAQGDSSINTMIDGISRVSSMDNTMTVGSDGVAVNDFMASALPETTGNIGIKTTGICENIFVDRRAVAMRGSGAIGVDHTASTSSPAIYRFESVEFFNENQTLFKLDSDNAEQIEVELIAVRLSDLATEPTTGATIFDVGEGVITATGQSIEADFIAKVRDGGIFLLSANASIGQLLVEDGGQARISSLLWFGDIEVETGATLDIIVNRHVGAVIEDGTINGIIGGKCYGTFCHSTQLIAASFVNQSPIATDTALQIEFGAAQSNDEVSLAVDGTVTFNKRGFFNVTIGIQYGRDNTNNVANLHFRILLNGVQVGNTATAILQTDESDVPFSVSGGFTVEAGDELTMEIIRDSTGTNDGGLFTKGVTAAGWNDSPSASIRIYR